MGKYKILYRNAMTLLCGQKQLLIDTHATLMLSLQTFKDYIH